MKSPILHIKAANVNLCVNTGQLDLVVQLGAALRLDFRRQEPKTIEFSTKKDALNAFMQICDGLDVTWTGEQTVGPADSQQVSIDVTPAEPIPADWQEAPSELPA